MSARRKQLPLPRLEPPTLEDLFVIAGVGILACAVSPAARRVAARGARMLAADLAKRERGRRRRALPDAPPAGARKRVRNTAKGRR